MAKYSRTIDLPGHSSEDLYTKVSVEIDQFLAKTSLGHIDIDRDASRREVRVTSSMFSATLACRDEAIQFDAQLGIFAAPFRSKIDQGIDKWLASGGVPGATQGGPQGPVKE